LKKIHVVLYEPEIPQNTGNISRTCAVTGAALHIIRPTGFEISDKTLKRAGLDYWDKLEVIYYDSFDEFLDRNEGAECYYFSSHAKRNYAEVEYPERVFLVFGKETAGLPMDFREKFRDRCIRLPMISAARSLNLSNTVAVCVYEALRQTGFPGLQGTGEMAE
jgi:tRNA (cytidine/uridine-2'-O-)-methyltransferase